MIKKFFSWIGDSLLNLLDDEPYIETKMKTSKQGIELIKEFEGLEQGYIKDQMIEEGDL